eukprot:TRINITY_DN40642_c0_g1_i1.p1 TRINITY_DN40642_c0_g1~~TRINITY_DN40642_c0_g1_i1.p1  ORF type:complete len:475 (-),score=82.29 TRINITY_DN40642_c0_g1_i1:8-1432(-)
MAMLDTSSGYARTADAARHGDACVLWETIVEVNATLRQLRVLLQRRRQSAEPGGSDHRCGRGPSVEEQFDYEQWSVRASSDNGCLSLLLEAPSASGERSTLLRLPIGEGVELARDCARCYADHISVTLRLPADFKWPRHLAAPVDRVSQGAMGDIHCRGCHRLLLSAAEKEVMVMPTMFWQECAEIVACEECAPLDGGGHIQTVPGRIYVSAQCILVCNADVEGAGLRRGADGLIHCCCGLIVGETQRGGPTPMQQSAASRPPKRSTLNLRSAYGSGGFCRGAGLSLYKHRVAAVTASDGEDLLVDHSEEAAVAAQLLLLRESQGASRFLLLPACPEPAVADGAAPAAGSGASAEALELRLVVRDLLVVGPTEHSAGHDARSSDPSSACIAGAADRIRHMVKVYYRRCGCTSSSPQSVTLGVPQMSFEAVCRCLDRWVRTLPASQALSPNGASDPAGPWLTSLLPLPPCEPGSV